MSIEIGTAMDPQKVHGQGKLQLENEFANITLCVESFGNGARLVIVDAKTARQLILDPLQLESIVWVGEEALSTFVDPAHRWSDATEAPHRGGSGAAPVA